MILTQGNPAKMKEKLRCWTKFYSLIWMFLFKHHYILIVDKHKKQ